MNIIISGPFGQGSLSDEIVRAGLLTHLKKHSVTIFTASAEETEALHSGINAVELRDPAGMLSNREALDSISQAHLLIITGAGSLSAFGTPQARVWLNQLEHARSMEIKTAVVGLGAVPIEDPRERVRIQRLLHNCTDGISARDEESKLALIEYGMSPTRVSNNGSPALALSSEITAKPEPGRIGFILAPRVPSRNDFSYNPSVNGADASAAGELIGRLLADSKTQITIFHDDTDESDESAASLVSSNDDRVKYQAASRPIEEIRAQLAECEVVFSMSLHGAMLCATAGVPTVLPAAETGAHALQSALGLAEFLIEDDPSTSRFSVASAEQKIRKLLGRSATAREAMKPKLHALRRKEAQNGRMLELLVPRRDRRGEQQNEDSEERPEGKRHARSPGRDGRDSKQKQMSRSRSR
jgi:polysaccharide pyruvyl transferase WcaK-like protein